MAEARRIDAFRPHSCPVQNASAIVALTRMSLICLKISLSVSDSWIKVFIRSVAPLTVWLQRDLL
jgi:hypothetical protein